MINKLAKKAHQIAIDHGFFDGEKNIGEMIALIHSEASEALEADRKDHYCKEDIKTINEIKDDDIFKTEFTIEVKGTFEDELAGIIIRVLDLSEHKSIDLEEHIKCKMRYNSLRPYKHGGKKY